MSFSTAPAGEEGSHIACADIMATLIAERLMPTVEKVRTEVLQAMASENAALTERLVHAVRVVVAEAQLQFRDEDLEKRITRMAQKTTPLAVNQEFSRQISDSSLSSRSVRQLQTEIAQQVLQDVPGVSQHNVCMHSWISGIVPFPAASLASEASETINNQAQHVLKDNSLQSLFPCLKSPSVSGQDNISEVKPDDSASNEGTCRQCPQRINISEVTEEVCQSQISDLSLNSGIPQTHPCRRLLMLPKVCGIVSWDLGEVQRRRSLCYQWGVALLVFLALGACTWRVVCRHTSQRRDWCQIRSVILSDLPVSLGAFAGLVAIASPRGSRKLENSCLLLLSYSKRLGSLSKWTKQSRLDLAIILAITAGAIAERLRSTIAIEATVGARLGFGFVLHLGAFSVSIMIFAAFTFTLLHISNALSVLVDTFCCRLTTQLEVLTAVHDWNILQSLLHESSESIQSSMFLLQLTACGITLVGAVDFWLDMQPTSALVSTAFPTSMVMLLFLRAAAVTDKCARVPPLVNSLHFDQEMDPNRQYVVEYIKNSEAGFHIFEIRITQAMVLKCAYTLGIIMFAVCTRRM